MTHHCHATQCKVKVPPEMFMCKRHWFMLPKSMRDEIWRTYRPGQCDDWKISKSYAEIAIKCVTFIAEREGVKPDIRIYEMLKPTEINGHRIDWEAPMYEVSEDRKKQLDSSFTYHSPKGNQPERYVLLRDQAKSLAMLIVENVPPGREQSSAITKLEEAIMWANKGIACNE